MTSFCSWVVFYLLFHSSWYLPNDERTWRGHHKWKEEREDERGIKERTFLQTHQMTSFLPFSSFRLFRFSAFFSFLSLFSHQKSLKENKWEREPKNDIKNHSAWMKEKHKLSNPLFPLSLSYNLTVFGALFSPFLWGWWEWFSYDVLFSFSLFTRNNKTKPSVSPSVSCCVSEYDRETREDEWKQSYGLTGRRKRENLCLSWWKRRKKDQKADHVTAICVIGVV